MTICIKCNKEGRLFVRPTFVKGKMYYYKYVSHHRKSQETRKWLTENCCNGVSSKEDYQKTLLQKVVI